MSTKLNSISAEWPALSYAGWESTLDTLHMWTQIVGKTRMALEPRQNHWWNVTLYVTPLGLTTSPMPYRGQTFVVDFDFVAHRLVMQTSEGPRSLRLGDGYRVRPSSGLSAEIDHLLGQAALAA